MKLREYLGEIVLALIAVATSAYTIACIIVSVGHIFFSPINEPTPWLATWQASLIALAASIVVMITLVIRLAFVGREAVKEYHQSTDEEKAFLRKIAMAILKRVKQSNGKWGQRAKAAEEFYREVKP